MSLRSTEFQRFNQNTNSDQGQSGANSHFQHDNGYANRTQGYAGQHANLQSFDSQNPNQGRPSPNVPSFANTRPSFSGVGLTSGLRVSITPEHMDTTAHRH